MPSVEVRKFDRADIDACVALLMQRNLRVAERARHPEMGLTLDQHVRPIVEGFAENRRANGAVAYASGKPVGFLFGERMMLAPADFASQFVPPHSISMASLGHAVADGVDQPEVYRALYQLLAAGWTSEGFFHHRCAIPAGDADLQEAWVALGFGRFLTAATRTVAEPVAVAHPRVLTIERASPEDIDEVMRLADDLAEWHWRSPIFWPLLAQPHAAARQFNLDALRNADIPFFVAYEDGRAVGMQTFLRPGFSPGFVKRSGDVYLYEGVVANEARGGGIGATLLSHSMAWARGAGFESCTLHFAPANPLGAPFWTHHGFEPVEYTMERIIDSRIAWARPRAEE
jgi:GNAT superfamily N-acetyltransferase